MLLEFKQVSVTFANFLALDNVSFTLPNNAITSLVGPNGAGKSTLLKVLLGLITPTSGAVIKPQKLKVSYLPQKLHLNPYLPLPVWRLLTLSGATKSKAFDLLTELKSEHLFQQDVHNLSGGQMQRILLARSVLQKPQLLVLDEPAQGIDNASCTALYQSIQNFQQELNCAVFMVSHDLTQALAISEKVICLNKHICCQGRGHEIHHHHAFAALFGTIG